LAVVGLLLAVCAHIYLGSLGIAGDPAPWGVWIWIGVAGLAFGVVVVGWRGARWWRRGMSLVAVPLSLLCAVLAIKLWVGYFPTVHAAWNQLTAGPLPDQTDRLKVTEMQLAGTKPLRGVVVPVSINSDASGFRHRRELVYLPPAWFATTPPPRLPAVMMIASALNTPADWLRAGKAVQTIDDYASAHDGYAPVLVFVDATGAFDNDTECVNGNRGNAADHLIKDVVPFLISNFAVSDQRSHFFDIPGAEPSQPSSTDRVDNPEGQDTAAHSLCRLGRTYGVRCSVVTQPGRHDWPFAAAAFATQLPWLAAQLGTPETPGAK
jgi:S-formylglutathione hydrolase FrmB